MRMRRQMNNEEIARLLRAVSAALTIKKADFFRIAAYDRAVSAVEHATEELKDMWEDRRLTALPGIGVNIASYLDELFTHGRVEHFNKIFEGLPEAMFELIELVGVGPKKAYELAQALAITKADNAIERLRRAGREGRIAKLPGFGFESQKKILSAIDQYERKIASGRTRMFLPYALRLAESVVGYLKACPQVEKVEYLGSIRRACPTIGDIDIAVATENGEAVLDYFIKYSRVAKVLAMGAKQARVLFRSGRQVDLKLVPLESWGSCLQHFTGSKQHNIHLREFANDKGLALSEYGIRVLSRMDQKSQKPIGYQKPGRRMKRQGRLIKFFNERDFYNYLGMDWIPPELREEGEEIRAAVWQGPGKSGLPKLITLADIKGDLHIHSDFDIETAHDLGTASIDGLVKTAKAMGYEYIALSEHNPSMSGHGDRAVIDLVKKKREFVQTAYEKLKKYRVKIFNSLEIDILPDGRRALTDRALDYLDFAIVAIHSGFRMSRNKMTSRLLRALDHPKVKIWAHPTGRILGLREGIELDWDRIFEFMLERNKFLEINSHFKRLDLPDGLVKQAIDRGLKLVINTDAHALDQMEYMKYGVMVGRRGWCEKKNILNTLGYDKIRKILL